MHGQPEVSFVVLNHKKKLYEKSIQIESKNSGGQAEM
jgi:hypothetical protein